MVGILAALIPLAKTLGLSAIISEVNRGSVNYEQLAARIIRAAQSKGQAALTKATQAINAIPYLSGSAVVKSAIRDAKVKAFKNYQAVERQVADMQDAAEGTAQEVQSLGSGSAVGRWLRGNKKEAQQKTAQALKTIEAVNIKGDNYESKIQ